MNFLSIIYTIGIQIAILMASRLAFKSGQRILGFVLLLPIVLLFIGGIISMSQPKAIEEETAE